MSTYQSVQGEDDKRPTSTATTPGTSGRVCVPTVSLDGSSGPTTANSFRPLQTDTDDDESNRSNNDNTNNNGQSVATEDEDDK